jgi:hypothetical protein
VQTAKAKLKVPVRHPPILTYTFQHLAALALIDEKTDLQALASFGTDGWV